MTLTEKEASERAEALYKKELERTLNGAQLLSKNVTETVGEDGVTVRCELYCLADIAKKVPLEINEITKETEE